MANSDLHRLNAYWREANFLLVGQFYLLASCDHRISGNQLQISNLPRTP